MKNLGLVVCLFLLGRFVVAQNNSPAGVFKISKADLSGENLSPRKLNGEDDYTFQQKVAFDGEDLRIYMVAIGNRTNEFGRFPVEEFIYWINGKARVEPNGGDSFEIQSGDYFIQPKGFSGKFNFVSGDPLHLELAVVSTRRADSAAVSSIRKAMAIEPDVLSGSGKYKGEENIQIYSGVELELNLVKEENRTFSDDAKDRVIHVLNGLLTVQDQNEVETIFYPGDFFVLTKGFTGNWESTGAQAFRGFEVYQVE